MSEITGSDVEGYCFGQWRVHSAFTTYCSCGGSLLETPYDGHVGKRYKCDRCGACLKMIPPRIEELRRADSRQ